MNRPSRKEIKAAIEKLKEKPSGTLSGSSEQSAAKLPPKKSSQRIRKKGI